MESYEKLVRDNIPEILDKKAVPYEKRIASPEEYRRELIKKLGEEVQEFLEASGDMGELADVIEVVEALKNFLSIKTLKKFLPRKEKNEVVSMDELS